MIPSPVPFSTSPLAAVMAWRRIESWISCSSSARSSPSRVRMAVESTRSVTRIARRSVTRRQRSPAPTRWSAGSRRNVLRNLDDHVGGYTRSAGRLTDGLGVRRFVEAIRLLLVGAQEGIDPVDAFVVVDRLDPRLDLRRQLDGLGEVAFDHIQRHAARLPNPGRGSVESPFALENG